MIVGAGIPLKFPPALERLSRHEPATYPLTVTGAQDGDDTLLRFAPRELMECELPPLQVGTAFAYCAESGMRDDYKRAVIEQVLAGTLRVQTDPVASPTNFPFKAVRLAGSISEPDVCAARPRICDLGFLREAYRAADGSIDYRCPGEPVNVYFAKGGKREDIAGRKCICNALLATIGQPQRRKRNLEEKGIITSGDDLAGLARFFPPQAPWYHAGDVVAVLLGQVPAGPAAQPGSRVASQR